MKRVVSEKNILINKYSYVWFQLINFINMINLFYEIKFHVRYVMLHKKIARRRIGRFYLNKIRRNPKFPNQIEKRILVDCLIGIQ